MRIFFPVALALVVGFALGVLTANRLYLPPKLESTGTPVRTAPTWDNDVFLKTVDHASSLGDKIRSGTLPLDDGLKGMQEDSDSMSTMANADEAKVSHLATDDFAQRRSLLRSAFAGWVAVIEIQNQIKQAAGGKLDIQSDAAIKQAQDNASKVQDYIENETLPE